MANFRSAFYKKIGYHGTESDHVRFALKELLEHDPVDLARLGLLCEVYGCPPAHRTQVWTLLLRLGCEVTAGVQYCEEQRREHFDDLWEATRVLCPQLHHRETSAGLGQGDAGGGEGSAQIATSKDERETMAHIFVAMYRLYHPDRLQFDPWGKAEEAALHHRAMTLYHVGKTPIDQFWLFAGFSYRLDTIHSGKAMRYFKLVLMLLKLEARPLHTALHSLHRESARAVADAWFTRYFVGTLPSQSVGRLLDLLIADSVTMLCAVGLSLAVTFADEIPKFRDESRLAEFLIKPHKFRSDCDWGRVFEGAIQFRKQHLVHIERAVSEGDESFVR